VIEGVISVLVMYRVVRRWAGVVPGLLAAGIFTLTPDQASPPGARRRLRHHVRVRQDRELMGG